MDKYTITLILGGMMDTQGLSIVMAAAQIAAAIALLNG
jgi:hypothetical protein